MASTRPRPSVLQLTERAAERVRQVTGSADKSLIGVRVGVKNGGCAGMEYTLDPVETPVAGDDVVHQHGVSVYIDPKAVLFLLGSVMDHETTKLRSGFVFHNPNEVSSCGCGESVMLKPAEAKEAEAHA
ncbi:MAG: iron-sulfur cluster assembly accessory protein [Hyphomicrobiales bacterium]|nr:iron-sulfur cluster assembly accessory protein [Hyphomicrobiales bacterium]